MTEEQVKKIIADYFGSVQHTAEVSMIGKITYAAVNYTDFKPVRVVRRELEERIPMLVLDSIERAYSDKSVRRELSQMIDHDLTIVVPDDNGTTRQVPLCLYIEERLFDKVCD